MHAIFFLYLIAVGQAKDVKKLRLLKGKVQMSIEVVKEMGLY